MKTLRMQTGKDGTARRRGRGFTLLELLAVIAIIGILAAIALPNLKSFTPSTMAAATRQFLDDVARARQLAMSQRTTVYMVFVPSNFWTQANFGVNWTVEDYREVTNIFNKQLIGYNFISLRSLGDQPGQRTTRYLSEWRTLPEGSFISLQKYGIPGVISPPRIENPVTKEFFDVYSFDATNVFPFPLATTKPSGSPNGPYVSLYYIGFNYMGQVVNAADEPRGADVLVPLGLGNVTFSRDKITGKALPVNPSVTESPIGNTSNAFNIVDIDWVTGRSRLERQEVQ